MEQAPERFESASVSRKLRLNILERDRRESRVHLDPCRTGAS